MSKVLIALFCTLLLGGCAQAPDMEDVKSQLLEVDREFSKLSLLEGTGPAFLAYMAEDVTVYPYKGSPISGRDTYQDLIAQMADSEVNTVMEWEPHFSDAALSGELGYTLGTYRSTLTHPDGSETITTGNYITVWKKQADGTWKFVFDGGNQN